MAQRSPGRRRAGVRTAPRPRAGTRRGAVGDSCSSRSRSTLRSFGGLVRRVEEAIDSFIQDHISTIFYKNTTISAISATRTCSNHVNVQRRREYRNSARRGRYASCATHSPSYRFVRVHTLPRSAAPARRQSAAVHRASANNDADRGDSARPASANQILLEQRFAHHRSLHVRPLGRCATNFQFQKAFSSAAGVPGCSYLTPNLPADRGHRLNEALQGLRRPSQSRPRAWSTRSVCCACSARTAQGRTTGWVPRYFGDPLGANGTARRRAATTSSQGGIRSPPDLADQAVRRAQQEPHRAPEPDSHHPLRRARTSRSTLATVNRLIGGFDIGEDSSR